MDGLGGGQQPLSFLELLGAVSTALAILATLIGVGRWLRSRYLATFGRRKVLRAKLKRLASEVRIESVENLFGPSLFRQRSGVLTLDVWWLDDAALQTICNEDGSVKSFSVTITTDALRYGYDFPNSTGDSVMLGVTPYAEVAEVDDSRLIRVWTGARHWWYQEVYYFGNPGFYQTFCLGYNDLSPVGDPAASLGSLQDAMSRAQLPLDSDRDNVHSYVHDESVVAILRDLRASHAPNTITVMAPHWSFESSYDHSFGADPDMLRVVPAFHESFNKRRQKIAKRAVKAARTCTADAQRS